MVIAKAPVLFQERRTSSGADLGYRKAERFLSRAESLIEGYFAESSLSRLTLLSRFIRRYFNELWEEEWMRDEIRRRSVIRGYDVYSIRKNGKNIATISFLDKEGRLIAKLQVTFASDGSVQRGPFCFIDRI